MTSPPGPNQIEIVTRLKTDPQNTERQSDPTRRVWQAVGRLVFLVLALAIVIWLIRTLQGNR